MLIFKGRFDMLEDILNEANSLAGETIDAIRDATASVKATAEKDSDVAVVVAMEDYNPFRIVDRNGMLDRMVVDEIGRRKTRRCVAELKRKMRELDKLFRWRSRIVKSNDDPASFERKYGVLMRDVVNASGMCLMVKDTLLDMLKSEKRF